MSLTWCQIGASLCLIGVSAWGIHEWVTGGPERAKPIEVVGPAVPAEETAEIVRWAMEHAGTPQDELRAASVASLGTTAAVARISAPQDATSRAIPVPANAPKGGGKVSYVGHSSIVGGGKATGRQASRDFTRALNSIATRRTSKWVPRFTGSRRR